MALTTIGLAVLSRYHAFTFGTHTWQRCVEKLQSSSRPTQWPQVTSEHAAEEEEHLWTSAWLAYLGKQRQNKVIKMAKRWEDRGQKGRDEIVHCSEISISLSAHFLPVTALSLFVPHAQSNVSSRWTMWTGPFQSWWLLTDRANLITVRMRSTYKPQHTELGGKQHFGNSRRTKWNLRGMENLPRKKTIKHWC